jgi:hypothetical protein
MPWRVEKLAISSAPILPQLVLMRNAKARGASPFGGHPLRAARRKIAPQGLPIPVHRAIARMVAISTTQPATRKTSLFIRALEQSRAPSGNRAGIS